MGRVKTNIMQSVWTILGLNTVICCLVVLYCTQDIDNGVLTPVNFIAMLLDAVVFVVWMVWAAIVIWRGIVLRPMNVRARGIVEGINSVVFAYWVLLRFVPAAGGPWVVPVVALIWIFSIWYAFRYGFRSGSEPKA